MKLAEALLLRSDLQKRIEQLKQRLTDNAKIQEGDTPSEDPTALLNELDRVLANWEEMVQRINRTNSTTALSSGASLADALATRDMLKTRHGVQRSLADAATIKHERFSRSEVKFVSTVSVAELQKQADQTAKEHRELESQIQALNWSIDLAD